MGALDIHDSIFSDTLAQGTMIGGEARAHVACFSLKA